MKAPGTTETLAEWAERELRRLCEAFPVQVSFNGQDILRPLARPDLPWRETPIGRILINLEAHRHFWRGFLQGLPIGSHGPYASQQVVQLRDDMIARLPDRQHLLNEDEDRSRIQSAIDAVLARV